MGRRWPTKEERASWNVIQWFPAELIESRRILERLRKDLTATKKYFKAGHTLQASDMWKRLTASGVGVEALEHVVRSVVGTEPTAVVVDRFDNLMAVVQMLN